MKTMLGDFGYIGEGLGADASFLNKWAKAIVVAWQNKEITTDEVMKDIPYKKHYPYPSLQNGNALVNEINKYKITRAMKKYALANPIATEGKWSLASDSRGKSYAASNSSYMVVPVEVQHGITQARNYIKETLQDSQEKLGLEKQLNELRMANEMAQAEITQARLKASSVTDQLQQAILQAQLDKAQSEAKLLQKDAEVKAKSDKTKSTIKKAGIATALATGAYFFLT
jgi:hypothetical protein